MATSKVFVVGPGYVGREIIDLLRAEGKYDITTLVRREAAAKEFQQDGVKAVLGDLNDSDVIEKHSAESDIVFHTATADHLASVQAILKGIQTRADAGKHTIYLHQSGASVLSDTSPGNNVNNDIYSDKTAAQVDSLSNTAPHRQIDLSIVDARNKLGNKAKIFVWMPPIIYGSNPKYGRLSIQVPALTRYALKHKQAGFVGTGKKTWSVVHVLDLARAYVQVLHWLETASDSDPELQNPYFFCESGETTWGEVASFIGKGLHAAGKIDTVETVTIPEENFVDLFRGHTPDVVGCNSRNRGDRLRAMGWKAQQLGISDAFHQEELPVLLAEAGPFKASEMTLS